MSEKPTGELTTRTMAMPADSNPAGDIFGGWVLSQMDIAAGICAGERAQWTQARALRIRRTRYRAVGLCGRG